MYNVSFNDAGLGRGSMPLPDTYKLSPTEYYPDVFFYEKQDHMAPGMFGDVGQWGAEYGMVMPEYEGYGLTKEEAGEWFKKNWKWIALGTGGVVALGIILKVVL